MCLHDEDLCPLIHDSLLQKMSNSIYGRNMRGRPHHANFLSLMKTCNFIRMSDSHKHIKQNLPSQVQQNSVLHLPADMHWKLPGSKYYSIALRTYISTDMHVADKLFTPDQWHKKRDSSIVRSSCSGSLLRALRNPRHVVYGSIFI